MNKSHEKIIRFDCLNCAAVFYLCLTGLKDERGTVSCPRCNSFRLTGGNPKADLSAVRDKATKKITNDLKYRSYKVDTRIVRRVSELVHEAMRQSVESDLASLYIDVEGKLLEEGRIE